MAEPPKRAWPVKITTLGPIRGGTVAFVEASVTYVTVVVKASFALVHEGVAVQTPPDDLVFADERLPGSSSLDRPSDLAPFVPAVDVLVRGRAFGPEGASVPAVATRLVMTSSETSGAEILIDKTVHVYGKRARRLAYPESFGSFPLVYDFAEQPSPDAPFGVKDDDVPNLVLPNGERGYAGFGPIAADWPDRSGFLEGASIAATTVDGAPVLALGSSAETGAFPFEFFQVAPPDQRLTGLEGGEWLVIDGMHPDLPRFATKLPHMRAEAQLYDADGRPMPMHLVCDTLSIDMDARTMNALFRGNIAAPGPLDALSVVATLEVMASDDLDRSVSSFGSGASFSDLGGDAPDATVARDAPPPPTGLEDTPIPGAPPVGRTRSVVDDPDAGASTDVLVAPPIVAPERKTVPPPVQSVSFGLPFAPRAPAIPSAFVEEATPEGTLANEPAPPAGLPFVRRAASAPSPIADDASDDDPPTRMRASTPPAEPPPRVVTAPPPPLVQIASPPRPAPIESPPATAAVTAAATATPSAPPLVVAPPLLGLRPPAVSPPTTVPLVPAVRTPEPAPPVDAAPRDPSALDAPTTIDDSDPRAVILRKLAKGEALYDANYAGADLSGIDFRGAALTGIQLMHAKLTKCCFDGARLASAKLAGADLEGATFVGAELGQADLSKCKLAGARFDDARLDDALFALVDAPGASFKKASGQRVALAQGQFRDANFDGATLSFADLSGADLAGASFTGCTMPNARLADARGKGARFDGSDLDQASFVGAELEDASFVGTTLRTSSLERARLEGCVFTDAKLGKAILARSTLERCSFTGADLEGANLIHATGQGGDFERATLTAADLRQTKLSDVRFDRADLKRVNAHKASLTGARFLDASLVGASLRGAKLRGADLGGADLADADLRDADLENARLVGIVNRDRAKLGGANLRGAEDDVAPG